MNDFNHLAIILTVEIGIERLCAVRNDKSLTECIETRHWYLLKVNNSNTVLAFLALGIRLSTVLS